MTNADWASKDFYKVLGVAKDATADEVKKAYRKLARAHHPDLHRDGPDAAAAEEKFKEVAEAYDVLGDEKKRKEYDDVRAMFASGGGFRPGSGPMGPGGFDPSQFFTNNGGAPFEDVTFGGDSAGGFGGLGDLLGNMFGGGAGARRTRSRRGQDLESEATISFTDAIEGVTVSLVQSSDAACSDCRGTGAKGGTAFHICPDCNGSGMRAATVGSAFSMSEPCATCAGRGRVIDEPCPTCHGSGRERKEKAIHAKIPAGVKDGQRIRLRGKGAPGEGGGPAGDVFVRVHVASHPVFARKGDNITIKVPVAFHEAALGAEVKVPTLGGAPVTVKIPAGTPTGRTFRVRGKGIKRADGTTGDLLVTVDVQVPASLNDEAKAAIEALRDASGEGDVRAALFSAGAAR